MLVSGEDVRAAVEHDVALTKGEAVDTGATINLGADWPKRATEPPPARQARRDPRAADARCRADLFWLESALRAELGVV